MKLFNSTIQKALSIKQIALKLMKFGWVESCLGNPCHSHKNAGIVSGDVLKKKPFKITVVWSLFIESSSVCGFIFQAQRPNVLFPLPRTLGLEGKPPWLTIVPLSIQWVLTFIIMLEAHHGHSLNVGQTEINVLLFYEFWHQKNILQFSGKMSLNKQFHWNFSLSNVFFFFLVWHSSPHTIFSLIFNIK